MEPNERQTIGRIFSSYYETAEFRIPGIEQREFGIGNIKKIDARHLSFASDIEFRNYLRGNTPFFVSHSIAYYNFPGTSPMAKKGFRGADLVFDLDIHAEGKFGAYEKLDAVKEDVKRLVNEFILNDFGVKKEHVTTVFSGNRGYHVHVRDPRFIPLGSEERREIVDYVMGNGLDYLKFFVNDVQTKKLYGPKPDEGGYRGRLAREVITLANEKPSKISKILSDEKKKEFFTGGIKEGNWSRISIDPQEVLKRIKPVADRLPVSSVDTDAGVTQDLSKLIRVPNSIHGETGLIAKIVDNIETFEPFRDAFIERKEEIKIKFTQDVPSIKIRGQMCESYKKDQEKEFEVPIGIFYVTKGCAKIM